MRLRDARTLIQNRNFEAAYYLTGLAVECAVKACIARNTRRYDFPPNQAAFKDIYTHTLSKLIGAAKLQAALDAETRNNIPFKNKWDVVKDWNVDSRYATSGLNAKDLYKAVAGNHAMATATLVNSDIETGRRIVEALTRERIPVTVYLWAFVPQLQEWQFIVATPLVDTKGPLAAYSEINKALQKEGLFDDVPSRRIFLKSPNDRVLRSLEKESRAVSRGAFRVVNEPIAGSFVEDAYLYTGSIHIVDMENAKGTVPNRFSVIYAPYSGAGAVPSARLDGIESLRDFLTSRLHIDQYATAAALQELSTKGSASIPNVQLRNHDLRRLGLI